MRCPSCNHDKREYYGYRFAVTRWRREVNSNCRYRCLNCQTTTSRYNLRHWDEWLRSPETPMSARRYCADIRKKEHSRSPLETSRIWFCDGRTRSRSGMNWSLLV